MIDPHGAREFTRLPLRRQVDIEAGDLVVRGADIRDVSLKGIYVRAVVGMVAGTECVVRLSLGEPSDLHQIEVHGRVARCT
jgi:PilZ domain